MQVMKKLQVADEVLKRGRLLNSISVGGPQGERWYTLQTTKVVSKYGFGTVAIHRAHLQSLLYQTLDKNKVHTGKRLKHFEQDNGNIELSFEDGTKASGNCLIGADGLRSVVRHQLFGNGALRYSGQSCWRGIAKFQLPDDRKGDMIELWGRHAGQRFAYSHISDTEVYYYATLAAPAGGKDNPGEVKDFMHDHYDSFGVIPRNIIEAIDPQTLLRTDLFDLSPIDQWTSGNTALLGDAAHATTPNLGQGAAQAIEDAYVLVSTLKAGLPNIAGSLTAYQRKRIKKAHFIVNTSWRLGQLTNVRNPIGIALRNWVIRSTPDFITERQIEKAYKIDF
jgi:2-polyprenyl-6-methoxyphenol hydroxylase-like FAD-dependent oxidoreductase